MNIIWIKKNVHSTNEQLYRIRLFTLIAVMSIGVGLICGIPAINFLFLDESKYNSTAMVDYFALKIWTPMTIDHTNIKYFYMYQDPFVILAAMQLSAFNTLFYGILEELCTQFDIMTHRLKSLTSQQKRNVIQNEIKKNIQHHDNLFT